MFYVLQVILYVLQVIGNRNQMFQMIQNVTDLNRHVYSLKQELELELELHTHTFQYM